MSIDPRVSDAKDLYSLIWDPDAIIEPPIRILKHLSRTKTVRPPIITQEKLILLFLNQHNVDVEIPARQPPLPPGRDESRNRGADALAGAFYGAIGGPAAIAAGSVLGGQQKAQALAREANELARYNIALNIYNEQLRKWENWKQWALTHSQWLEFSDEHEKLYQEKVNEIEYHNQQVEEWYLSPDGQGEIRALLISEKRKTREERIEQEKASSSLKLEKTLKLAFCVAISLAILIVALGQRKESSKKEYGTHGIEFQQ